MSRLPVALVAGASRGLGLLIAAELACRGHDVAMCARDEDELRQGVALADRVVKTRGQVPVRLRPYQCDVSDREDVRRLVADVERDLGPIEVLIHVAGIIQVGPAEAMTLEHFDDAIGTMLLGPVHTAWSVLPGMRERDRGRIGIVTSIGGKVAPPHLLPYATAKFGAVGFTEGLAAELAGTGVTATTVVPGLMRTGSQEQALFTGDHEKEFAWFGTAASLPLLSMDAERAARRIVDAVLRGKPEVVLTPLAQVGMRVHGLAPELTIRAMGLTKRLLPKATGGAGDSRTVLGRTAAAGLDSPVVHRLTGLGRAAARKYNERYRPGGPERPAG